MHVGIDIREACGERPTGKGKWTEGFVLELLTRGLRVSLFTSQPVPSAWNDAIAASGANVVNLPSKGLAWHRQVAQMLKPSGIDVYISPVSYIVPFLVGSRVRCIPMVHDLIAFRSEKHDRKARFIERLTLGRSVKTAWKVCTISDSTKHDLLSQFPSLDASKVFSVFAGGGEGDAISSVSDGVTIVSIGTLCPRKNQLRLIRAFDRLPSPLRKRAKLVLVGGRGWDDAEIVRLASSVSGVEWKGYASNEEIDALMRHAAVCAYPSLYEGFGLPLLQAMRHGVPLLTSDRGSLKEVAGDSALFVDPEREESIAQGLEKVLTDESLRKRLIEAGNRRKEQFTWKRTVDLFLEGIRE